MNITFNVVKIALSKGTIKHIERSRQNSLTGIRPLHLINKIVLTQWFSHLLKIRFQTKIPHCLRFSKKKNHFYFF